MSAEPTAAHPSAEVPSSPLSSISSSPAVASMRSAWSSLPRRAKLIIAFAVVGFFLVAGVIGVSILGVVGSSVFGGGIEAQVSSRGEYVEQQFLRSIDDLKVTK